MNIAVMGFGVVGSGTVDLIYRNHELILKKTGLPSLEVSRILDLRDFPDSPYADRVVKDFALIEEDPDIELVVETMGGLHPAYEFVSALLARGKSVVTSNKELVAAKGCELLRTAKENGANFLFEASVGGGIPLLRPIYRDLGANRIDAVAGILNGTTNYILTQMIEEGTDFDDALKTAQKLGYAERDPSADIDGIDASRKICILASLCFGSHVYPEQTTADGIRSITLADVAYAADCDRVIKLIGAAARTDDGRVGVFTGPCLISRHSQLAGVSDVFNAVLVRGDAVGDSLFYGRGAGKLPTASAVVADVIDCAMHRGQNVSFDWDEPAPDFVVPEEETETALYVRGVRTDGSGTDELLRRLGAVRVLHRDGAPADELAFLTETARLGELRRRIAETDGFTACCTVRVTDF